MINLEVNKQLPVIQTNFDMVKASLSESIKKYKGLIVTAEGLKECKADQKELASMRIKIDNYRKEIKKEVSKPITEFEDNCKTLIALIANAENPLKEGISIFDQKVRDTNRKNAEEIIESAIIQHGLNEKYASQLTVLEKYCNLTAKSSDIKNDVETRLFLLLQEQETEIETLQIMVDAILNVNKNIDAKLSIYDFQSLIDMKVSPVKIMAEINARGERIRKAEVQAIEDKKARAEKEVLDRIARAEREALAKAEIERKNIEKETERIRAAGLTKIIPVEEIKTESVIEPEFEFPIELELKPIYFIEMRIEGNLDEIKALSQFLKDRQYKYLATKKGELNAFNDGTAKTN
jgi:hypothetical protein